MWWRAIIKITPFRPQISDVSLINAGLFKNLVSEMKLWKSRRDKRLNCYRVINKITFRLLKQCFLIKTYCCWGCGGWPWLASKHPPSCSLSPPPQAGWGKKIQRRGAKNKDRYWETKMTNTQTLRERTFPLPFLVSCPCYHHSLHSVPLARQSVAQNTRVRV